MSKLPVRLLALVCSLLLAACAGAAARPGDLATPPDGAALAMADEVDYACTRDTDCTVKNIGNCCGYFPACVNAASPTFPDKVKADCAREGRMAICGFPEISACRCVARRCENVVGTAAALQ